jgi:hypothetical protein
VTFADELTALATELAVQQKLFQKNTFATTSALIYTNLADVLDRGRETCETEPTLHKIDSSIQQTIRHITEVMEELSDLVKDLAVVREGYVQPQGAGSVGPGIADLEAVRKSHAAVRQKLKELAGDTEDAARSVRRHGGAANGSQQTNEKRPYRAVFTRMEGECRRGLRRSG